MKDKISKVVRGHNCIIAFVVSCLVHFLILSYSEFLYGRYTIVDGDSFQIYIPAIKQFWRDVISGSSVFYSWTNSYGMNTAAYNAYNVYSVFNILFLIFYNCDVQIVACLVVVVKAGVAAAFFELFIEKVFKTRGIISIIPSVCYAVSSYIISYSYINFIWMDAIFMLPLILLLVHFLIDTGKAYPLVVAYSYLYISNFYMAYMVGIFSAIYFVTVLLWKKSEAKKIYIVALKYLFAVLLSIGLAAIVLVPTARYFIESMADDSTKEYTYSIGIWKVINQLFIGQFQVGSVVDAPYIYCGILVFLLVPGYFLNQYIRKQEKLCYGFLLSIMVISIVSGKLNVFWHCFDVPDGWTYRFSFIISFLLCVIMSRQMKYLRYIDIKVIVLCTIVSIGLYVLFGILAAIDSKTYLNTNTILFGCINVAFLVGYIFLLLLYKKKYYSQKTRVNIAFVFVVVVAVELLVNGCAYRYRFPEYQTIARSEALDIWIGTSEEYMSLLDDDSLYRVDCISDYSYNSDTFWGYNGLSDFGTIENQNVRNTLNKLGIGTSPRIINEFGTTDFTNMILGVKYKIGSANFNSLMFQEQHATVEEFPYYASIGFTVDKDILDFSLESDNSFKNINSLASLITRKECEVYDIVDFKDAIIQEEGIRCYVKDNKIVFEAEDKAAVEKALVIMIPTKEKPSYVQIDCGPSISLYSAPFILFGPENSPNLLGRVGVKYIKELLPSEGNSFVEILMTDYTYQKVAAQGVYLAYYNEESLQEVYDAIKDSTFKINDFDDGYVHGNISVEKDNQVLYLSIPYDDGWSATVNGDKKEIKPILGDAFMGIELGKGEYEIELKYNPPYVKVGGAISLISLIVYVAMIFIERKQIKIVKKVK